VSPVAIIALAAVAALAFARSKKLSARHFWDSCEADEPMSDDRIAKHNVLLQMVYNMGQNRQWSIELAASLRAQAAQYASDGFPMAARCINTWAEQIERVTKNENGVQKPLPPVPLSAPVVTTRAVAATGRVPVPAGKPSKPVPPKPVGPVTDPAKASNAVILYLMTRSSLR